jgi:hypothetical protein
MSESTFSAVDFSFKEVEPDFKTVASRFKYFFGVTDPRMYFVSDQEILKGVQVFKKYKNMAKESPDGVIKITQEERY